MATRHQFIFTNKTVGITTILFKNLTSIQNIEKIVFFKETELKGHWLKKEYRYSFDDVVWSSWRTFTQQALQSLDFANHSNFWMEALYTRRNYNTADINDLYLFYESDTSTPSDPSTALIDADTLQGEPGSFYLDPSNFIGPYPGIQAFNVEDSSAAGVYSHRIDTSIGTEFYFKRIEGVGIQVTDSSEGIITLTSDASGGTSIYENADPVKETVGGIIDGDSFFAGGKTFAETMYAIFYPVQNPTLTGPSATFVDDVDDLVLIGSDITANYTAAFNRGSISPQYTATSPYRSGTPNTYRYVFFGSPLDVVETSLSNTQNIAHTVTQGIQTSNSYISFNAGVQPYNSDGDPYSSPLSAGRTDTIYRSFEGVYPLYATTSDIANVSQQSLISMIDGDNIEMTLEAEPPFGTDRQKIDIPDAWLTLRPLVSIQFYSDFEAAWKYEGGTISSSLSYWTTSATTHFKPETGTVAYTRYSYNPEVKQGSVLYRLNFS